MENCVAPGLDAFDVLLEVVLSLVRVAIHLIEFSIYRNNHKFSDRQVLANSVDPDQRSLIRVYTVCHSSYTFWTHYSMVVPPCSNFRMITSIFRSSEILGFLRYILSHHSNAICNFVIENCHTLFQIFYFFCQILYHAFKTNPWHVFFNN